jgi:hypothetical protein
LPYADVLGRLHHVARERDAAGRGEAQHLAEAEQRPELGLLVIFAAAVVIVATSILSAVST